jgi:hypothetical protein
VRPTLVTSIIVLAIGALSCLAIRRIPRATVQAQPLQQARAAGQ